MSSSQGATAYSLSDPVSKNQAKNILDSLIMKPSNPDPWIRNDAVINFDFGLYHGETRINMTKVLGLSNYALWIPISSGVGGDPTNGFTNVEKGYFSVLLMFRSMVVLMTTILVLFR